MGNSAQCCGQIEATWCTVRMRLDESGGENHAGRVPRINLVGGVGAGACNNVLQEFDV